MNKITTIKTLSTLWVAMSLFVFSCTEAPIIIPQGEYRLNSPSSMVLLSGTDCAIVSNANVNLDQRTGALIVVNLDTETLLVDTLFEIPNFSGNIFLDEGRNRIYVPDHDETLSIYEYEISGTDCDSISFSEVDVPYPIDEDHPNGIELDDGPAEALMIPGTSLGDVIFVTSQVGSVSVIPANTLKVKDMDEDGDYSGLKLFSASNFENADNFPGRGANRMTVSAVTGLVYITSSSNNQIYVLNPVDQSIEAMIDLDSVALPTVGMRDIQLDNSTGAEMAYVAHSGLDSIIIMDVSGITANNIPYEIVSPPILDVMLVGDGPEDIKILSSGAQLFVSNQKEDSVYTIDTVLRQVTNKVFMDQPKNPGRLVLDEPRNRLYSLDFYSNTISIFNATTGDHLGTIK
jgi:YVTN family beta-propeller protein